jgi:hypothetical protein
MNACDDIDKIAEWPGESVCVIDPDGVAFLVMAYTHEIEEFPGGEIIHGIPPGWNCARQRRKPAPHSCRECSPWGPGTELLLPDGRILPAEGH